MNLMITLFGLNNRTVALRRAPKEDAGKYDILEFAIIDKETNAVGSVGIAIRSDVVPAPIETQQAEVEPSTTK